jgi:hypothetical protein
MQLVHGDLCGPITPVMPRGNKYFLLLMDDLNRYMWVAAIPSNDYAAAAIKEIQERLMACIISTQLPTARSRTTSLSVGMAWWCQPLGAC